MDTEHLWVICLLHLNLNPKLHELKRYYFTSFSRLCFSSLLSVYALNGSTCEQQLWAGIVLFIELLVFTFMKHLSQWKHMLKQAAISLEFCCKIFLKCISCEVHEQLWRSSCGVVFSSAETMDTVSSTISS